MRYIFPTVVMPLTFFFSYVFFGDKSMQVKVHLYYEVITNLFYRSLSKLFYSIYYFVEVSMSIELKIPHRWPVKYKRTNQHAGNRLWHSPLHWNILLIISGDSSLFTLYISVAIEAVQKWYFLSINNARVVCLFYCLSYNCGTSK